jgi:hypothetical protein
MFSLLAAASFAAGRLAVPFFVKTEKLSLHAFSKMRASSQMEWKWDAFTEASGVPESPSAPQRAREEKKIPATFSERKSRLQMPVLRRTRIVVSASLAPKQPEGGLPKETQVPAAEKLFSAPHAVQAPSSAGDLKSIPEWE